MIVWHVKDNMIPTTIVDNFFETPTLIRDYALSLEYSEPPSNYPGIRTKELRVINPKLDELLGRKLFSLFFNLKTEKVGWNIGAYFQLADRGFETGWSHIDGDVCQFAGVVYLNPDAPLNGGTSMCRLKNKFEEDLSIRDEFYSGKEVDYNFYRSKRDEHNSNFETTLEVSNIFNRLFLYDGNSYHKENMFFGEGKDARLTLVFFGNFVTYEQATSPLTRAKTRYTY
jgi:hypothetical protein